jgi:RimJ/RimL family protein N-acetyltransferase
VTRLRAARPDDCARVFAINFAPDVRAVSKTAAVIPYGEHETWFARRLATPAPFWMIEDRGAIVGVVRIDLGGRISIALDECARGKGIGRRAIAAACAEWDRIAHAEIDPANHASIACFEACGFVRAPRSTARLLVYTWRPGQ